LTYRTGDIVSPRVDAVEPLSLELQDFHDAVRNDIVPRSSAKLGVDVVRMVEAVEQSLALRGVPIATADVP
jgi:predicted dehydrogenase